MKTLNDYIRSATHDPFEINEILENDQKADDLQAGGTHYKEMGVQPWTIMEYLLTREEFIGYLKGNIIKYGMRQGKKDSPDADKCRHYMQKLKEIEQQTDAF